MEGKPIDPLEIHGADISTVEAFEMTLRDIKILSAESRELLLTIIKNQQVGLLTLKIDNENTREVSLGPDQIEEEKINAVLDAVEELEKLTMPLELAVALDQAKDSITASFEPYH